MLNTLVLKQPASICGYICAFFPRKGKMGFKVFQSLNRSNYFYEVWV